MESFDLSRPLEQKIFLDLSIPNYGVRKTARTGCNVPVSGCEHRASKKYIKCTMKEEVVVELIASSQEQPSRVVQSVPAVASLC